MYIKKSLRLNRNKTKNNNNSIIKKDKSNSFKMLNKQKGGWQDLNFILKELGIKNKVIKNKINKNSLLTKKSIKKNTFIGGQWPLFDLLNPK
jgi:hypothetical protein